MMLKSVGLTYIVLPHSKPFHKSANNRPQCLNKLSATSLILIDEIIVYLKRIALKIKKKDIEMHLYPLNISLKNQLTK